MSDVIKLAETDIDLKKACVVLKELRTHLTEAQLLTQVKEQRAQGYQVAVAESDGTVTAVAGFVITLKLAWGTHMYVDDLVTGERWRATGVGGRLMAWLKDHARQQGCGQLHLDSGVQRFAAHRFYLRHGFDIASHHFSITDLAGDSKDSAR